MPAARPSADIWVIVLAGGDGKRLAPLTRALYGLDVPKQFAALRGDRTMLQTTVERAALLAPASRTVVVVGEAHEAIAREQLAPYRGVSLLVQPANLDTGPGLLLPLAWVRRRSIDARVVVMPADHDVPRAAPLVEAIHRAASHRTTRGRLALIGVVPDRAETEYGWIQRGARLAGRDGAGAWRLEGFREKPDADVAARLRARGALWNTFIMTGPVEQVWRLGKRHLPKQARVLERWARGCESDERARLRDAYRTMEPGNWSVDVLSAARRDDLAVVDMRGSGWSDWGSPRRVFQSLAGTPDQHRLLSRIADSPYVAELEIAA
jgi:mannose-1-phosphate guanylyltransferase